MLADVVDLLRCPHCAAAAGGGSAPLRLSDDARTLGCRAGHRFDVARQGHVNLLRHPAGATADTAAMVADRAAFLAAGHYAPIAELVATAAVGRTVVEPGAGTGYYLAAALDRLSATAPAARGLATDLSAYACRRSAKLPRTGAVVADTWAGLPIGDAVADTVLTVFAPRNLAEFARICSPAGRVAVVTPLPDHLAEVRRARGLLTIETDKHARLLGDAEPWLVHQGHEELRYRVHLTAAEVSALIGMGPNAFHEPEHAPSADDPSTTTVAARLDVFTPQRAK